MAEGPVPEQDLQAAIAERDAWAQALFESERFAAELTVARHALADRLATAEARAGETAALAIADARRERDRAIAERDAALQERDQARAAQQQTASMLARVTGSTSWRLTAPLRHAAMRLLGRTRGPG